MRSTIIYPDSRVSDFSGNSRAQKLNKAQTKRANITGVQYFRGLCSFARINRSGVNFVLSFKLSLFYFLTICANLPFHLRLRLFLSLRQSTLLPFLIACPFLWVLCYRTSIHRPLTLHRYAVPVQGPPADAVSVKIFRDSGKLHCL